ncbi:hypothetical protein CK203_072479 [Vitis vinifera]|uniref:Uncharacterized protein n=1 Tax=Vitis vinifera TaxID=29760 RepID=A0A438F8Z2_VITVI|nr:hypothetical protein CK203_072479 [Vitis vinifera]
MSAGVVRSLGAGRFLDWRALDASGSAGGVLICGTKDLGNLDGRRAILISRERSRQGKGYLAMRRFAQVIDDLELVTSPCKEDHLLGVEAHNQSCAGWTDSCISQLA